MGDWLSAGLTRVEIFVGVEGGVGVENSFRPERSPVCYCCPLFYDHEEQLKDSEKGIVCAGHEWR